MTSHPHIPHTVPVTKRDKNGIDRTYHVRPDNRSNRYSVRTVSSPTSAVVPDGPQPNAHAEDVQILAEGQRLPERGHRCTLLARIFSMGTAKEPRS